MKNQRELCRSIRYALVAGFAAAAFAAPVFAQDQNAEDDAVMLDEVVITGTRITTPNAVSSSPVTSVGRAEIDRGQPVAVEDIIKQLPGAVPAIGPGTNNGSGGGATIDLRGLGANRTLVLIDGRRPVPFDLSGVVDTNSIPLALIQRVDLVTGGASAVYGADAVAGVINFITKRNYEGLTGSFSYGTSEDSDADNMRADVTIGGNFADDRGNAVMSIGKTTTDPLLQGDRSFGLVSRSSTTGSPQGSGTTVPVQLFGENALAGQIRADGSIGGPVQSFNFNPLNLYQSPLDRVQATALASFKVMDSVEAYGSLTYTRSDVGTQLAPSGSFFFDYAVPIGNPFIPALARAQICADSGIPVAQCVAGNPQEVLLTLGRRFVELGPRLNDFENKNYQYTVGLRGDITETWGYDAYYSSGEADQVQTRGNWGSRSRVQQALRAVSTTACLDTSNRCVPLNIFGQAGSITPEMINFFNLSAILRQIVDQSVASGSVSGDFGETVKSPWTDFPIGAAFGIEQRRARASTRSDSASQSGDVLGTGAPSPDQGGSFDLLEGYGELNIPLVSDRPGFYDLSLEAGYRYSEFTTSSTSDYGSWKFGGSWAPIEDLRFRALMQRATRAPNIGELFQPTITGLNNLAVDPCQLALINPAQANTPGTLSNLCRLTGVPVGRIGALPAPSAGQVNVLVGGNPLLGPEEADTLTVGFVWSPAALDAFQMSFDFYDISVEKTISGPSVSDVVNDCFDPARNPGLTFNAACAAIGRSPTTGTFNGAALGVGLPTSNLGKLDTRGLDLNLSYELESGFGMWNFAVNANHVLDYTFQATPNSVVRDCVGFYSVACGIGIYDYKINTSAVWTYNTVEAGLMWRYLSSIEEEPGGTVFLPAFASISSYSYFDLSMGWKATDQLRLNLSVRNLLDKQPPEVGNTIAGTGVNSGNTFPQYYDTIGRFYTLGATVTF